MQDDKDLSSLKALAEVATQGEWRVCGGMTPAYRAIHSQDGYIIFGMADATVHKEGSGLPIKAPGMDQQDTNSRFIARANPQAILSLISRIESQAARIAELERDEAQSIAQRDHYHDMADKLAAGIAEHFAQDIGEHSSNNCPWLRALDILDTKPEFSPCAGAARPSPAVDLSGLTQEQLAEKFTKAGLRIQWIGQGEKCRPTTVGSVELAEIARAFGAIASPARDVGGLTEDRIAAIYKREFEGAPGCARHAPTNMPPLIFTFARAIEREVLATKEAEPGDPAELMKRWPTAQAFIEAHPEEYFESNEPVPRLHLAYAVDLLTDMVDNPATSPAPSVKQEASEQPRMSTTEAREYLVEFMMKHFTDKTFHRYIRAELEHSRNNLAGDFAWQMASALKSLAAPSASQESVKVPEGWISVEDRLPDYGQTVAVLFWPFNNHENKQITGTAEFVDGGFYTHDGDEHHPPSHWMPLPAAPSVTDGGGGNDLRNLRRPCDVARPAFQPDAHRVQRLRAD